MSKIYFTKSNIIKIPLPIFESGVSAGFPSPAEDHLDLSLDLNEYIVKHPSSTFYIYAKGDSMIDSNIQDGDLMVVDKSINPNNKSIVIAVINGEFTVKRILYIDKKMYLSPDNQKYNPIEITTDMDFEIWGVVTHVIHQYT
tara:strand:+ start:78 stop:503 length:426 start_codon:yes stop_codon:yes gene_type:complete